MMGIDILELRDVNRQTIGIVDTAESIIWHRIYYGLGDFEVHISATPEAISLFREGHYITRPDDVEVGIIEAVDIAYNTAEGYMLTATGRFAKQLLNRRLIYNYADHHVTPYVLRGNVEASIRKLVRENAIFCSFDNRRSIPFLKNGEIQNFPYRFIDADGNTVAKQVTYRNLQEYTDEVLEEYGLSALLTLNREDLCLYYDIFEGQDHSLENSAGNPHVIFSTDFDNVDSMSFKEDKTPFRNAVLVGGEGEGVDRFYSVLAGDESGVDRRELFLDASQHNKKYYDEETGDEEEYTDAEYNELLTQEAENELQEYKPIEYFDAMLNVTGSQFKYKRDFGLGDFVSVQDNRMNRYYNARIGEITEIQDGGGYNVNVVLNI